MIYQHIEELVQYGINEGILEAVDRDYARNQLLALLQLEDYHYPPCLGVIPTVPFPILEKILDWSVTNGLIEEDTVTYRDLFDTALMNCLVPRPSEVTRMFKTISEKEGQVAATNYFYQLSKASHYIRVDRIAKNQHWLTPTEYGDLEITINLSKPEKDPKAIAAARNLKSTSYPICLLCKENVGYKGRVNHPARQTHRVIPVTLQGEEWFLQFSPYVYYNEHAIVLSGEHTPMKVSKKGFDRLLEFVEQFPHYFVGSNADLPIVGGSILSHDHFQGGYHEFPMAKAGEDEVFRFSRFEGVSVGIVHWPMSVLRLRGKDRQQLSTLAGSILKEWREYSDESVGVYAYTGEEPHNTITPIARFKEEYELDLVLRNNRTSEEHPLGIFHPHEEVHHIKKENIGLIEVMGLAVLPGRLAEELEVLGSYMLQRNFYDLAMKDERTKKHVEWAKHLLEKMNKENVQDVLKEEVGKVFSTVLEHAGVFKRDTEGQAAFRRFIHHFEKRYSHEI